MTKDVNVVLINVIVKEIEMFVKTENFLNGVLFNDGLEMQIICANIIADSGELFDAFQVRQAAKRLLMGNRIRAVIALNSRPFYCAQD